MEFISHQGEESDDGEFGIKALSPEGLLEDVKGIKYSDQAIEGTVNGTSFAAHVKAIPQSQDCITDFLWHVKAVHPDGKLIDIKAIDENGRIYDVKALAENGNGHIMDIKAFVGSTKLPVKILASTDRYAPLKAIGLDGKSTMSKRLQRTKKSWMLKG
ncbi:MAG: hypothetical protein IPI30_14095 [Saprospiraceae bacterium]|nr:hypothetical protein [Candidatus Vicinibacter affinis]